MPKLDTFLALDNADRLATIEAMAALLYCKALVGSVSPRHWRSSFGPFGQVHQGNIAEADLETVRRVRLAIVRALRNIPGAPNCLPQALAARRMLARRGIASDLYIGTKRNQDGIAKFHAWLKVGGEWVTGLCDENEYRLFIAGDAEAA